MPVPTTPLSIADRVIDKQLLSDSVYERLLGDIITGRYEPEERLNVDAIAEEFGVSRTPVREALQRLSSGSFVEVVRNSRTQVSEWDASDRRDRLDVMGRLVCLVLGDPRLDIAALAATAERAGLDDDPAADAQVFLDLAQLIVSTGVNRVAEYVLRELITPLRLFLRTGVLEEHGVDLVTDRLSRRFQLAAVLDAAQDGLPRQAEAFLGQYLIELAGAVSPRDEDRNTPPSTPAAVSPGTAARSLHAVR